MCQPEYPLWFDVEKKTITTFCDEINSVVMLWFDPEYNQIVNEDIIKAQYDCFASEVPGFKKSYEEFKKSYEEVERSYFETLRKYII